MRALGGRSVVFAVVSWAGVSFSGVASAQHAAPSAPGREVSFSLEAVQRLSYLNLARTALAPQLDWKVDAHALLLGERTEMRVQQELSLRELPNLRLRTFTESKLSLLPCHSLDCFGDPIDTGAQLLYFVSPRVYGGVEFRNTTVGGHASSGWRAVVGGLF